ncbi:MipA/OmpV family protein [Aliiglaciecola sp. 3_MG-2023]|uniref:MipA/OmpV family protein n=1 Tax=Aliiglaciecola sp. 3_MG-2023 TaxID=3062644 RepID=UPI0026E1D5AA|nr:MipA/OmpV family protein [Aliiglaciecola sp. 3_MG-2023]MDO6695187.1 MipA/OmpV family protein [Aliiglaciecola sp. 3_MG-2023]
MSLKLSLLWLIAILINFPCFAQIDTSMDEDYIKKPRWEAGIIGAGFSTPEYPGAADNHNNGFVLPFFIYRGDIIRVGENSVIRAVAVEKSWLEIDLSLDAAFSADSSDDSVRAGMPDLDFVFEVGPQIRVKLFESGKKATGIQQIQFKLQSRGVFSTDFSSITHRGYVLNPELTYQYIGALQSEDRFRISISPIWGTEKLHDYFYQVDAKFATAQRPEYDAKAGYLGVSLSGAYMFNVTPTVRMFMSASYRFQNNAANIHSPLLVDNNNYAFGAGIVWQIRKSTEYQN